MPLFVNSGRRVLSEFLASRPVMSRKLLAVSRRALLLPAAHLVREARPVPSLANPKPRRNSAMREMRLTPPQTDSNVALAGVPAPAATWPVEVPQQRVQDDTQVVFPALRFAFD